MTTGSRPLRPLIVGEHVFIQNQQGTHPTKWDRSGVVMEDCGHDQYCVKVDGTGRLTRRNRRFLRAFRPATLAILPRAVVPPQLSGPADSATQPSPTAHLPRAVVPSQLSGPVDSGTQPSPTAQFPGVPSHRNAAPPTPESVTPQSPQQSPSSALPSEQLQGDVSSEHLRPTEHHAAAPPAAVEPQPTQHLPSSPSPPEPRRSCRQVRPPKRYEPETGRWKEHV